MLRKFLIENENEILAMTERQSSELAGVRPSSTQLKQGLPVFYQQLIRVLDLESAASRNDSAKADRALSVGEAGVTKAAGIHGAELLRLGYTLSHVVHAYGALCQSITGVAIAKGVAISSEDFRDLNRCLDVAIAGTVMEYQSLRNAHEATREVEHLGFLAHELRNALGTVTLSVQLIKEGTVGFGGKHQFSFRKGPEAYQ